MQGVSFVIPARNEIYLQKTIEDILKNIRGDSEIIAVLDGYWPDPPIKDDKRVTIIHHVESIGQRYAINEAAKIATKKFICKLDGHSAIDEGFDVKMMADCKYDETHLARMYNLDVTTWTPKIHKVTDYMWIRSPYTKDKPFRHNYWDGKCAHEYPAEYKKHKKMAYRRGEICDVMTGQGACFFMHLNRFWELGGCDTGHGSWGQQGVEVALKAWLSGGSLKVNKKTWFAHFFRGGTGPGFPYPIKGRDQQKARNYSVDFWMNGRWPLQTRPMEWLVNKFSPLPTWDEKPNGGTKNG